MKLDPTNPNHPVVWSVARSAGLRPTAGCSGPPALYKGVVYAPRIEGHLLASTQQTGKVYWQINLDAQTLEARRCRSTTSW